MINFLNKSFNHSFIEKKQNTLKCRSTQLTPALGMDVKQGKTVNWLFSTIPL